MRVLLAVISSLPVAVAPAVAQELPGDPAAGLEFAEEACAPCHQVSGYQHAPRFAIAPSFLDVANTRGMSATALYAWLQSPHPTMPNIILAPQEATDVVAYIWSLRDEVGERP